MTGVVGPQRRSLGDQLNLAIEAQELQRHFPGWGVLCDPGQGLMAWFPDAPGDWDDDSPDWDFDREVQARLWAPDAEELAGGIQRAAARIAEHGSYGPHASEGGYNAAWSGDHVCHSPSGMLALP